MPLKKQKNLEVKLDNKKTTRIEYIKKLFKENPLYWGWLRSCEQELFIKSPKVFTKQYFETWNLKAPFELYLQQKREEEKNG